MCTDHGDGGGLLPVPISALQHMSFCPRQCALIHVEYVFDDNVLTVRGKLAHECVDTGKGEMREGVRIERSLPLWCEHLGLTGKADMVEFHPNGTVFPVEYKHGKRHQRRHDDLQLCAQALCLEEMLGVSVPRGAMYHHSSRRRREVEFTPLLRDAVAEITAAVRELLDSAVMPPPATDNRCCNCSLRDSCAPSAVQRRDWPVRWREMFAAEDMQ